MTQEALRELALDALELVNIEFVCNGAHHAKKDRHLLDARLPCHYALHKQPSPPSKKP
jgi:hypothetical protein